MKKDIQQGLHVGFDVGREEEGEMWIVQKKTGISLFLCYYIIMNFCRMF